MPVQSALLYKACRPRVPTYHAVTFELLYDHKAAEVFAEPAGIAMARLAGLCPRVLSCKISHSFISPLLLARNAYEPMQILSSMDCWSIVPRL